MEDYESEDITPGLLDEYTSKEIEEQKEVMEEMDCWLADAHIRSCKNHQENKVVTEVTNKLNEILK